MLVYHALYSDDLPLHRRITSDWIRELERQTKSMAFCLSVILKPCVERVLSFLEADFENVKYFLAVKHCPLLGPCRLSIASRVAHCLDVYRHSVRRILRASFMQCYWDRIGRPRDHVGDSKAWHAACQEIVDFAYYSASSYQSEKLTNVVYEVFTDLDVVNFWLEEGVRLRGR